VGTYVYNGASLALDGGISISGEYLQLNSTNAAALNNLSGNNLWGGEIYLSGPNNSINVGGADSLIASGLIDGPGALVKVGSGNLILAGNANNTYAGETFVNQGTLLLDKPIAVTAIPTALEIGAADDSTAGTARNLNSYQIVGNILVHAQGLYDVNGLEENVDYLHLYGGATVQTGTGWLYLKTGGAIYVYPQTNSTATINGHLGLDPGNHLVTVGSGATSAGVNDLVINAAISQSSTDASLQKEGSGRMRLTGPNTYTGPTTINAGILQVDGSQGQSAVTVNSGTLQGGGTVGAVSLTSASAKVSPGASPGILNSGGLGGGSGTVRIELNGTTAGTSYDQLNVSGSVNLSGMSLNATLGYASSTNDQFTIIANDGTDPVTGTFTGLAQGKKLYIGQELFQISYNGGSGNDVVLSRLITPPPPTLTIQQASPTSVRLLWPTNDPPFSLQTASSLPASNWSAVLPLPVVIGTNNVVTNFIATSQQFYRLSSP
jgi:autotransporter-associated beta strand protein